MARLRTIARPVGAGLAAGAVHYGAHKTFGEPGSFQRAGVTPAGVGVALATAATVAFFEARDEGLI